MIYIFVLLLTIFFQLSDKGKYESRLFFLFGLFLIVFCSFRYGGFSTGDYFTYVKYGQLVTNFNQVIEQSIPVEIGFRFVSYIINYFQFPKNTSVVFMGIISTIPVIYIINKYSCYKFLSVLVWLPYFFTMNMHSARTSVAAGMGLLFLIFIFEKKYIKAFLSFIVAVSFHQLSLGYFFITLSLFSINILITILIFIMFFVAIFDPIQIIVHGLDFIGFSGLGYRIMAYSSSDTFSQSFSMIDPRSLLFISILCLYINISRRINERFYLYISKLFLIGGIIMYLFSSLVIISWRLSYLFFIVNILFIPKICEVYNLLPNDSIRIPRLMNVILSIVYTLWVLYLIYGSQNYSFILFPSKDIS
ncbi:EpsG family protein [Photobacterium piscicola]|uniref:EpsG family protein n=1 Tax=Photobacterium piscicola TaxID=1378299 RepID=UPI002E1945CF|nr:EpsG family protein [Photobacterium piscicola]